MENDVVSRYSGFKDLPEDILCVIFKKLSAVNLVTAGSACNSWQNAAVSSEVWRNVVFKTTADMSNSDVANHLKKMPKLKHFVCQTENLDSNTIIDAMIQYCTDIRSLDCSTSLVLEPVHVFELSVVYQNLESFSMHTYFPEHFINIMQILSTFDNLKEMFFSFPMYDGSYSQRMLAEILGRGFPALQNLDLQNLHNAVSQRGLAYVLHKKKHQLTSLTVEFSIKTISLIVSRVSQCTSLKSLNLTLGSPKHAVNLDNLTELRSLNVCIQTYVGYDIFNNIVLRNPWPRLDQLSIRSGYTSSRRKLISQVFHRFPTLKQLSLYYVESDSINTQLLWISQLSDLKHLELVGYWSLTGRGLFYICECPKLQTLELSFCTSLTDESLEYLKYHPSLRKLVLTECFVTGSTMISIVESLNCLQELTIKYCPYFDQRVASALSGCTCASFQCTSVGCTCASCNIERVKMKHVSPVQSGILIGTHNVQNSLGEV